VVLVEEFPVPGVVVLVEELPVPGVVVLVEEFPVPGVVLLVEELPVPGVVVLVVAEPSQPATRKFRVFRAFDGSPVPESIPTVNWPESGTITAEPGGSPLRGLTT
jgi:hypothetical protein